MRYCYDCGRVILGNQVCRRDVNEHTSWTATNSASGYPFYHQSYYQGTGSRQIRVDLCPDCARARDDQAEAIDQVVLVVIALVVTCYVLHTIITGLAHLF
jgi:hypothetical protein